MQQLQEKNMYVTLLIFITSFFSCNSHNKDVEYKVITTKTVEHGLDSTRVPFSQYYLSDLNLRDVADLIVNDSVQPIDNNITFSILDSVTKGNKNTREYFREAFDVILIKSDGALSEVLGIYCISSISENPNELITWLSEGKLEATTESIVQYVVYELSMNSNPEVVKDKFLETIRKNISSSENVQNHTDYFVRLLNQSFKKTNTLYPPPHNLIPK